MPSLKMFVCFWGGGKGSFLNWLKKKKKKKVLRAFTSTMMPLLDTRLQLVLFQKSDLIFGILDLKQFEEGDEILWNIFALSFIYTHLSWCVTCTLNFSFIVLVENRPYSNQKLNIKDNHASTHTKRCSIQGQIPFFLNLFVIFRIVSAGMHAHSSTIFDQLLNSAGWPSTFVALNRTVLTLNLLLRQVN